MNSSTTGVVGLGTMGMPIAKRLLQNGFEVYGHDVRAEQLHDLSSAGGAGVRRASMFPEECTVFLLLLPTPEITHAAIFGEDGLSDSLKEGDVVANLGTIGPDAVIQLGRSLAERGVTLLDTPMGKSSKEAAEGTLSLMVAGDEDAYHRFSPLFQTLASDITYCGELGVASTIKIVNNLVSGAILEAVAEGLVLGAKAGAPLDLMVEALSGTGADSWHLRNTFAQRVSRRNFEPGFSVDLETKDIKIGLDMAHERGVPLPVISGAYQRYLEAQAAGLGSSDWGALAKLSERTAGIELGGTQDTRES